MSAEQLFITALRILSDEPTALEAEALENQLDQVELGLDVPQGVLDPSVEAAPGLPPGLVALRPRGARAQVLLVEPNGLVEARQPLLLTQRG